MSVYRKIVSHSAIYSVGIVLGKVASVLMLPLYTRYLTPTDYGILELLDLTIFVVSALIGIRLSDAMVYHYFAADTPERRDQVLSTAFIGASFVGLAGGSIGWFIAPQLSALVLGTPQYAPYFRIMFASLAFAFPQDVGFAYRRAENRSGLYLTTHVIQVIASVALNVLLLVVWRMGVSAMIWGGLITYAAAFLYIAVYLARRIRFSFRYSIFQALAAYGWPLGVSGLAMLVVHYGDRFFLRRSVSLADIGVYALAYKLGMLVSYVQLAFNTYWSAQMFQVVLGPGGDRVYVRICTYYSVLLFFVALGISLFSRPVLGLLVTPAFRGAVVYVPAVAVAYVVRSVGDHFRSVFFLENRTGKNAQVTIWGAIVCAVAYAVLIPWLKVWGAILATTIAFVFMGGLIFWEAQRVKRYEFEIRRLVQAALCAIVCGGIGWSINVSQLWLQFLVAAACVCLFPVTLFVTRFFDQAELGLLRRTMEALQRRMSAPAEEGI